jgi:hypothetical protein
LVGAGLHDAQACGERGLATCLDIEHDPLRVVGVGALEARAAAGESPAEANQRCAGECARAEGISWRHPARDRRVPRRAAS